jgi:putative addiction module killer protein
MSTWQIKYWIDSSGKNPVDEWLTNLEPKHSAAVSKELNFLKLAGNTLPMPHSKALGKGLFELRERCYHYRIYYGFNGKQIIIILMAGNKKSQEKDIKIARKRLQEI